MGSQDDDDDKGNYTIVGSGNYTACVAALHRHLFHKNARCPLTPCSFNGVFQPSFPSSSSSSSSSSNSSDIIEFFGVSSFVYIVAFFNMSARSTLSDVERETRRYCGLDWQTVIKLYPTVSKKYLATYCFLGSHIVSLAGYGYGLPMDKPLNFVDKIGTVETGWALGAMIYEANLLPFVKPHDGDSSYLSHLEIALIVLLGFLFALLVFMSVLFIWMRRKQRQHNEEGTYQVFISQT